MKTLIADIFPKIQRFSKKLDNLNLITNKHWVSIDSILTHKTVFIFRNNGELLISTDGKVEKGGWEYLGNSSILINKFNESFLFKHGFLDENILALRVDSKDEYAVFVNENRFEGDLNSLERITTFLEAEYYDSRKSQPSQPKFTSSNQTKSKNKPSDTLTVDENQEPAGANMMAQVLILFLVIVFALIFGIML